MQKASALTSHSLPCAGRWFMLTSQSGLPKAAERSAPRTNGWTLMSGNVKREIRPRLFIVRAIHPGTKVAREGAKSPSHACLWKLHEPHPSHWAQGWVNWRRVYGQGGGQTGAQRIPKQMVPRNWLITGTAWGRWAQEEDF